MAAQSQPQSAAGGTPPMSQYHSAYCGYTVHHGQFTHFIRKPDKSHLDNGFWCFASSQDEFRAFGRGYHTPEDILIAVDSGEHDEFTDINLFWLPGRVDTVLRSQISGNAAQHIRVIYDMRIFLRKSLSFRGRVPTYPVDARLGEYWASRRIPASSLAQPPVVQATARPASSPLQSASLPSPVVGRTAGQQQAPISSARMQNTHRNSSLNPGTSFTASPDTRSPAQLLGMTGGTPLVPNDATTSPGNARHQVSFIQNSGQPQAPPTRIRSPPCNTQSPYSVPALPPQPPHDLSSPGHMYASNPAQQNSRSANISQSGNQFSSPYGPRPSRSSPYGVISGQSISRPGGPHDSQRSPSTPLPASAQNLPISRAGPLARQQLLEAVGKSHLESLSLENTNAASNLQQLQRPTLVTDEYLAGRDQTANSTSISAKSPVNFSFDDEEPITVPLDEMLVDQSGVTPLSNTAVLPQKAPIPRPTEPETRRMKSLKRPMEADVNEAKWNKRPRAEDNRRNMPRATPEQAVSSPVVSGNVVHDMYPGLPCMDCGEDIDIGHRPGCHLDITPMKNLTVLDYRNFADSVQRFDPGPWTTHQGSPPEPELEDPEVQIRGMANIIRNEETYKTDAGLHSLPDELMVMVWAMKTAPNLEVICDSTYDSGIGASEPE